MVVSLIFALGAASGAIAAEQLEYRSSFGPDGTAATEFEHAGPLAVDQGAHAVYVIDAAAGSLYRFDIDGNPVPFTGSAGYIVGNAITGLSFFGGPGERQVAVDSSSHRIYVTSGNAVKAFESNGEPAEFLEGTGAGTSEIGGFGELLGVAVDTNGNIYAADFGGGNGIVRIYSPAGAFITSFSTGTSGAANLAVDGKGAVYVNFWLGNVSKYTPSRAPVSATTTYTDVGTFNPTPSYTVAVDPATNEVYIAEHGLTPRIVHYRESGDLIGSFAGPGEEGEISQSEGIAVDGLSSRVFVANVLPGGSQVEIFQPFMGPPTLESVAATGVTADAAILRARINPNTLETSYRFEYGLVECSIGPCTSVPAEDASIGSGYMVVLVAQGLQGLRPSTTYHYRLIARNAMGASEETHRTFTTQGLGLESQLSDARVWEMVSPPNKLGGLLVNPPRGPMQAAENGDGLAYQSVGSIEVNPDGNRAIERSTVLARREGLSWRSKDITPPHIKPTVLGPGNEYNVFSRDLGKTLVEPLNENPLSPQASAKTPYLRHNSEPPVYSPLVTSKGSFANVPPGTAFGEADTEVNVSGATRDLSHVVLRSEALLVSGAEPLSLYIWGGGRLSPVSALPSDEVGGVVDGILGSGEGSVRNAISEDGSRVFWSRGRYTPLEINTTALYLRETNSEKTVRVDIAQPDASGLGSAHPAFQGASADGTVAFFTDSRQLTKDASPEGRDLYRCEVSVGAVPNGCALTNITGSTATPSESAEVQGVVPAFSADGEKVYFVARGILDTEPNDFGQEATSGELNLYLWRKGEQPRFIALLAPQDSPSWGVSKDSVGVSASLSAASSPSGRYFSFMSQNRLTGYENRDVVSGRPNQEVFLYDAADDSLVCASCNPTGASPEGQMLHVDVGFAMVDPQGIWEDQWVAATLPEARTSPDLSLYRPRAVLDNGRIFFNAADSLVPGDSNRTWDVYQYEPVGMGSCGPLSASSTVARTGAACVALISSGSAEEETAFLDASGTGNDVFFLTAEQLSALDKDTVYDIYDARVGGVAASETAVSECAGDACRPAIAPPMGVAPISESFRGRRNRVTCLKGKKKVVRQGKRRCVRRHHSKRKHRKRAGQVRKGR
jgi:hypothetical protein